MKIYTRILVIRLSSLGDILLTTPLLRALKNNFPESEIDFLVKEEYKDTLRLNPNINRLLFYGQGKNSVDKFISQYKSYYDLIIDLQNNFRSAQLTLKLKSPVRRFKKYSFRKWLLVNTKINLLKKMPPIADRYFNTMTEIKPDGRGPEFYTDKNFSSGLNGLPNLIGIAPGSRHYTKSWPVDYYSELIRNLINSKYNVVLLGGADDIELCKLLAEDNPEVINLCKANDLLQIGADLKKCRVLICNDSGLMHLASAVNVPVVAFFGSTVKEFGFLPYKVSNLILENNLLTCRPCSHIGRSDCPRKHFKCMKEISPGFAFNKILDFIGTL
ncbi:MAG: glycosyltransferase family 9 protein [Ignavibacteriaceae bacterium]